MKKLTYILLIAAAAFISSCDPNAVAEVEEVELDVEQIVVSAGFCEYVFETDVPAYFISGIMPVYPQYDPASYPKQFMSLMIDSAYGDYLDWRRSLLIDGIEHVADFPSHSLQYSYADRYFHSLQPDTEYWVYAFVVDARTLRPAGLLYFDTIRTLPESNVDMHFNYRINGAWDYIYPIDSTGTLLSNYPWAGITVDSLVLREKGYTVPGQFFTEKFVDFSSNPKAEIFYGVYSHNNNGGGTTGTLFEEGHTYYTGLALMDGPIKEGQQPKCYDIFRFTWTGHDMQLFLTHDKDNTFGAW